MKVEPDNSFLAPVSLKVEPDNSFFAPASMNLRPASWKLVRANRLLANIYYFYSIQLTNHQPLLD